VNNGESRRSRGLSLRARIVAVVLVAALPGFILAFLAAQNERKDARRRADAQTEIVTRIVADRYDQVIHQSDTLLRTLIVVGQGAPSPNVCKPLFRRLVGEMPVYDDLVVASPSGNVTCSGSGKAAHADLSKTSWFNDAKTAKGLTVGPVESTGPNGSAVIWVARPVRRTPTGPVVSVLAGRISVPALGKELFPSNLAPDASVALLSGNQILYARPPLSSADAQRVAQSGIVKDIRSRPARGTVVAKGVDGVDRVFTYQRLPRSGNTIVYAGVPTSIAFAKATHDFRVHMVWLAIALALALVAAILLGEFFIARRVRALVGVTRRIAAGDLEARVDTPGSDEIGVLELSVDAMAEQIEHRDEERLRLLGNVVQAAEAERRRIAGDVHDDSIQIMTAHVMALQLVRRRTEDPALAERLRELEDSARGAIARLRDLIFELHSPVLEELGLGAAIEALCERTFEGEPVRWSVVDRLPEPVPRGARDTGYRVAQEAIGNARRHAQPSRVTVQLTREHEELVVRVSDDGQGFDPDGVGTRPGHRGLLGAGERAEAAGGTMTVTSRPGDGTTVTCRVPWLLGASFDAEAGAIGQERPSTSRATSSTSSTPLST
jgi:signal transduction histidine kinase